MAKVGTVVIEMDANTAKLIKGVKESNKRLSTLQKSANDTKKAVLGIAAGAVSIYALSSAFKSLISASFNYNVEMENAEVKLNAMISASKGYETVTGRQVTAMERQAIISAETAETMQLLKKANSETAMGMTDLISSFALMKPAMDESNVSTKDQVQILKLVTNTASTFGLSAQELATGIDDLGRGTYKTNQGFGRMMKSIGVSREEIKSTSDLVGYLNEKMKETGEAQDTWTVAVSNFGVAFDELNSKLTDGIFDQLKNALKDVTKSMNETAPKSMQVFADAIVSMANGAVKSIGFILKAVNQLIGLLEISYAGYIKLEGLLKSGSISEAKKNIAEYKEELVSDDRGFWGRSTEWLKKNIKLEEEKIKGYEKANSLRREGEKIQENATKRTNAIHNLVSSGVKKFTLDYTKIGEETEKTNKSTEKLKDKVKTLTTDTKKAAKSAKEASALYRKFLTITGQTDKLFQLDVDKQMKEFIDSGKYSMQQLSDIYDGMWKDYSDSGKDANRSIIDDISNSVSNLANAYKDGGLTSLGQEIGNMLIDGANMLIPGLGTALETVGALFSSHVTQYDIEASRGKVEFDDDSLANLESVFADAQYPMLEVTNKMHKHIRNMDANFYAVARALSSEASSGGVDLTGVNFVDTFSESFLGFSSKTVSLISTGLAFELQSLNDLMSDATLNVKGYTTTLVQKSSWFGLSNSSKIRTAFQDLPPEVVSDIANSFADGYEAILLAGTTLGLDSVDLEAALRASELDIGKIDFTGLSPSEVSDRLSQVFSTAFSGVIYGIDEFTGLVDKYAVGAEYALETLVRISIEFDQASHSFSLIGKQIGEVSEALDIVASTGGITEFQDAMGEFMDNFYTDTEQLGFMTDSLSKAFDTLGIAMPSTNDEFRSLLETMDTTSDEGAYLYGQVLLLAESFNSMTSEAENLNDTVSSMIGDIADAWLGNLSYLTLQQKADYASGYLALSSSSLGAIDTVEAARLAAETALRTTSTKEEYIPIFNAYIEELKNEAPEATTDDVVNRLDDLIDRVIDLEETTRKVG